jgi:hypothetical protein
MLSGGMLCAQTTRSGAPQSHLSFLSLISYEAPKRDKVKLPSRDKKHAYDDEATINALDRGEVLILSASLAQPEHGIEPAQELGSFCGIGFVLQSALEWSSCNCNYKLCSLIWRLNLS